MRDSGEPELDEIVDYLDREAPWELERLRSLDQLVSSGASDWADENAPWVGDSYSSWLGEMFALFRSHTAFDRPT